MTMKRSRNQQLVRSKKFPSSEIQKNSLELNPKKYLLPEKNLRALLSERLLFLLFKFFQRGFLLWIFFGKVNFSWRIGVEKRGN
jgi:hypothetical protein